MKHRRKGRGDGSRLVLVTLVFLLTAALSLSGAFTQFQHPEAERDFAETVQHRGRRLLQTNGETNCTPRAIEQFPDDFFTQEQRKAGGVVVHVLIAIYVFASLAIICDDYFVPSLEKLCEALHLQADVAGATFMAAGSSAPELFTSIIGLFFAHSDVGVGTIVGSAVFNILFIIAICGLFSGMVIYLTWWPLMRDSLFYMLSVVCLVAVISDGTIHWYEATVMLVLYIVYIVLMFFNPRLGGWATRRVAEWQQRRKAAKDDRADDRASVSETQPFLEDEEETRLRKNSASSYGSAGHHRRPERGLLVSSDSCLSQASHDKRVKLELSQRSTRSLKISLVVEEKEEYTSPLTPPKTWPKRVFWVVMLPFSLLVMVTVPDVRRPGCWTKLWALTFATSIIWIAGLSYVMVWMVTIIGDTIGIPDTVMGLTFLAAGTSIPDALASLFVARDGFGDMAVSNSIGSNVFDILLCLGLPWFIQTAVVDPGGAVTMASTGLLFSAITLLGTVVFLVTAVVVNKWKLDRKMGLLCVVVYAAVMVLSCLYELNVFGEFNPPPCPSVE